MLRRLDDIAGARLSHVTYPGAFLTEIAERGFGVPARHILVGNERDVFIRCLQAKLDILIGHPLLEPALNETDKKRLSPLHVDPANLLVEEATVLSLLTLLNLKDALASTEWIGWREAGNLTPPPWVPFLEEDYPLFLTLAGLEQVGAVTGVEEVFEKGSSLVRRSYLVDRRKLTTDLLKTGRTLEEVRCDLYPDKIPDRPCLVLPPGDLLQ